MELRVASTLASFGGSVSGDSGFPVSPLLQLRLPMWLRVSPSPHLPACLRSRFGFPRILTFRPGYGLRHRVSPIPVPLGLPRDFVFEFPRIRNPLAPPSNESPGFPESRILCRRRLRLFGSPRILRLRLCHSASSDFSESCVCGWADDDSPAKLELCILDARPRMNLRVQSGLAHSCLTLDALLS